MHLISHRGNITGPEPLNENKPSFIQGAIDKGYDVEIDVRLFDRLYLGHDRPDYPVELSWLIDRGEHLLIHAKNFEAMDFLIAHDLKVFYHQAEKHAVIGNTRTIWSCCIPEASEKSIIPLISMDDILKNQGVKMNFYGVCSDYIGKFKP